MRILAKKSDKQWTVEETSKHVDQVGENIGKVVRELQRRADHHDDSKFGKDELPGFVEFTPKLEGTTYGSDEYKELLKGLKPTLDHHYKNNRHHPEYHKNGIDDMNLIDMVEMFCDWWAATKRHADGDIIKSIKHNKDRFKMNDQLVKIFENTAKEFTK